ncbi:hypothetical protein BDP27DRAFT_1521776 [Rhodocollybia butyracea]|uniref:CHAT domain-containing protein n=1 Tax=Rhodocollybia butyracea TaxID=206335 RepID=A0A9P5PTU9_9AGAR|nr:hypothetical protein BDP27DRAFT_1521776 [Rhodocollybia butyracea]
MERRRRYTFSLNNLSLGLQNCFQQTGHIEDLNESILLNQEALSLRPVDHSLHASSLNNLIESRVLLLHPVGHPQCASSLNHLSSGLQDHFQQTGHIEDLNESILLNQKALPLCLIGHPQCASLLNNLGLSLWNHFQQKSYQEDLNECVSVSKQASEDIYSPVSDCLKAVKNWVQFTRPHPDLAQSNLDAYILGLSLISHSLSMMPFISLQYQHLSSTINLPEFASDAASQAIRLGQLALAVAIIEQGWGLLWSELRGLRMPMDRLKALEPLLADEMAISDPFGHRLSEKLHLLRAQELKSAAKYGPVIVVNCSKYRSDVLIVLEQDLPVLIPMVKGFYEEVETLVQRFTEARSGMKTSPKRYNHDLWDLVVSPVVSKLRELHIPEQSQIFWCPTSLLSTLPLHAAGPIAPSTKKFLPDLYISSYTPTLTALILPCLLVAGQYDSSLRNTKEEMNEITVTSLEEASATTKDAVEKALVDHEWLHIASHGTLVPTAPFSSYFLLAGGSHFTLLDIICLNLHNATFAFLSACHTAEQFPGSVHNESVVGTMWEMADVDGPEMVKDFYSYIFSDEHLSRCNEVGVQARALSEAIKKMRGRNGVTLERWVNFVHIGA